MVKVLLVLLVAMICASFVLSLLLLLFRYG